ncbi:MAG: element excision factor XisH family protein [Blastocatellia bacterium]
MARRDSIHFMVRRALEKDGWTITHDPIVLAFKDLRLKIDLAAEHYFAAEKEGRKIAVEVKDFDRNAMASDLQKMIGQLQLYQWALEEHSPGRDLYLGISQEIYDDYVQNEKTAFHAIVKRIRINLVVCDTTKEEVLQWIKQ